MAQTDATGQLSWLLDNLVDQVEHVEQAVILSTDGLGVASSRSLAREAGPVVRPYAATKGRTLPSGEKSFGLIDVVFATGERPQERFRPGPEHRRILSLCRHPTPVVDLIVEIDLPIGVVRVLLDDLAR